MSVELKVNNRQIKEFAEFCKKVVAPLHKEVLRAWFAVPGRINDGRLEFIQFNSTKVFAVRFSIPAKGVKPPANNSYIFDAKGIAANIPLKVTKEGERIDLNQELKLVFRPHDIDPGVNTGFVTILKEHRYARTEITLGSLIDALRTWRSSLKTAGRKTAEITTETGVIFEIKNRSVTLTDAETDWNRAMDLTERVGETGLTSTALSVVSILPFEAMTKTGWAKDKCRVGFVYNGHTALIEFEFDLGDAVVTYVLVPIFAESTREGKRPKKQ